MSLKSDNTTLLSASNVMQMYCRVLPTQFFLYALSCIRNTVNGAIVGSALDSISLAAIALYAPFVCILAATYGIISFGCTILCGHKLGRGDIKGEHEVFSTAVCISTTAAFIIGILMIVFAKPLALILGSGEDVLVQTIHYIQGQSIGIIPTMLIPILASYIQINNRPRQIFVYAIIQGIALIIFVPASVYIFDGGLLGVSIASSLSAYVPLVYLIFYIKNTNLSVDIINGFNISHIKRLLILGIPAASLSLLTGLRDVVINNQIMITEGASAIAAMAILSSTWLIIDSIVYGSGNSVRILSSVFYGEHDRSEQINLFKVSSGIGLSLTLITGIIYVLLSYRLATMFGANAEIANYTFRLILIYCIGRIFTLVTVVVIGIYQSCNHTLAAFLCNSAAFFVFPLVACFLLKANFGLSGIWYASYVIGPALMLLLVLVFVGRLSLSPFRILLLNEKDDAAYLSISLHNIDEAINISERIQQFCVEHNAGSRRSYMCGLCLEEMAVIIYSNGYYKRQGVVDILVRVDDEFVQMRLRDNAPEFDLTKRFAGCSEIKEDPAANIGIRIVMKSAESASYTSVFGTNTLLLKF